MSSGSWSRRARLATALTTLTLLTGLLGLVTQTLELGHGLAETFGGASATITSPAPGDLVMPAAGQVVRGMSSGLDGDAVLWLLTIRDGDLGYRVGPAPCVLLADGSWSCPPAVTAAGTAPLHLILIEVDDPALAFSFACAGENRSAEFPRIPPGSDILAVRVVMTV